MVVWPNFLAGARKRWDRRAVLLSPIGATSERGMVAF
jgi:hypothetical protein